MTDLCINGDWTLYGPTLLNNIVVFNPLLVGLGISMTLPKWYGARILPRSSTYGKFKVMLHSFLLGNEEGVIEYDYSKEWLANLIPFEDSFIADGTSILQFEVKLLPTAPFYMKIADLFISGFRYKEVDVLHTTRGGFGSSDKINYNTQNLVIS
jgi:dUTPase